MNKFERVQILRFFAAVAVIAYHAYLAVSSRAPADFHLHFLRFGLYGVDLFFVVSGFIIVFVSQTRETSAKIFLMRRVARIIPIYWIATLTFFIAMHLTSSSGPIDAASTANLVRSITFATWTADGTRPVVYVGWTLEFEMLFYGCFAIAMALKLPASLVTSLVLAGTVLIFTVLKFDVGAPLALFLGNPIILEFIFGMICAAFLLHNPTRWWLLIIGAAPLLMVLGSRAVVAGLPAILLLVVALALDSRWPINGLVGRMLVRLGDASYSQYLVQVFAIAGAAKLLGRLPLSISPDVAIVVITAISIAAGYAVFLTVEVPLRRWTRTLERGIAAAGI